jgi:hypothetical protein
MATKPYVNAWMQAFRFVWCSA